MGNSILDQTQLLEHSSIVNYIDSGAVQPRHLFLRQKHLQDSEYLYKISYNPIPIKPENPYISTSQIMCFNLFSLTESGQLFCSHLYPKKNYFENVFTKLSQYGLQNSQNALLCNINYYKNINHDNRYKLEYFKQDLQVVSDTANSLQVKNLKLLPIYSSQPYEVDTIVYNNLITCWNVDTDNCIAQIPISSLFN